MSLGRSTQRFTKDAVFSMTDLPVKVQRHLVDVYSNLFMGVLVAACGVTTSIYFAIESPLMTAFFAVIALIVMQGTSQEQHDKRVALFSAFCFFKGMSIGPLVNLALHVDPSSLVLAALATAVVFGSFSLVAMTARRREYLYLAGTLSSLTGILALLGLANLFMGNTAIFEVLLWGGLALFIGWVVVDTQVMIEKASFESNPDALLHAAELFIDMVAIFVRILIILLRNSKKRD